MLFSNTLLTSVALATVASAAHYKRVNCPDGNTASNEACCAFFPLRDDLQKLFNNQCGEKVHEVLRLTFHDGLGFSMNGSFQGNGADGSIVVFNDTEVPMRANNGTGDGVEDIKPLLDNHNVTAGDLVQFAAAVGLTNCPGAPQIQFLAGRPPPTIPASDGSVPEPQDSVSHILARFSDVGISPDEVIALLASHSIARSDTLIPNHNAVPFDTTPFTFDTQIYLEVMLKGVGLPFNETSSLPGSEVDSPLPESHEMRLQSDFALSRDPRTSCTWQGFVDNQQLMMDKFKAAMAKLATIGQDVNSLVDCTEVLGQPPTLDKKDPTFPAGTDQSDVEQACSASPFPTLSADNPTGTVTVIPPSPTTTA